MDTNQNGIYQVQQLQQVQSNWLC